MIREKAAKAAPGLPMLFLFLAIIVGSVIWVISWAQEGSILGVISGIVTILTTVVLLAGLFVVHPNQAQVVQLFGNYVGSQKSPGLWWMNPFCSKKKVSLRVRNFETSKLKVNDKDGNPVEIAAVIVWKVVETAEAIFQVDHYEDFVHVQSEAAVRNLATTYPYDAHEEGGKALRSHTAEIAEKMQEELQVRLEQAGVQVLEARMSHLAYAPEIASAMLQRQQASAVVAARSRIVEGAVGMVEMALRELSKQKIIELDEEHKAAMVSNLLVVLCGDRNATPVINTGTLHQ